MAMNSTQALGARLLKEIGDEEGTLEGLLKDLRATSAPTSRTGLPALDALWQQHGPNSKLNITGRGLTLLYHILTALLTPSTYPKTVALVDLTHRFSPSHLTPAIPVSELQHIHIFRATPSNLKVTLESIEGYMLYGEHGSKGREWVGTIVNGGTGGDINVGWRGWLRVEREETGGHQWGTSVEEAFEERESRWSVVEGGKWRAVCGDWVGVGFVFS